MWTSLLNGIVDEAEGVPAPPIPDALPSSFNGLTVPGASKPTGGATGGGTNNTGGPKGGKGGGEGASWWWWFGWPPSNRSTTDALTGLFKAPESQGAELAHLGTISSRPSSARISPSQAVSKTKPAVTIGSHPWGPAPAGA